MVVCVTNKIRIWILITGVDDSAGCVVVNRQSGVFVCLFIYLYFKPMRKSFNLEVCNGTQLWEKAIFTFIRMETGGQI